MILYPNQGAGMCNRLWAAAHLIAHVEEAGNTLLFGSLIKFRKYFHGLTGAKSFLFSSSKKRPMRLCRAPFSFLRSGAFPAGEIGFDNPRVSRAEQAAIFMLIGWRFRDAMALTKHRALVRQIFTPRENYREVIADHILPFKAKYDQVVGVHLRRGDYRTFRDGKYIYSDEIYRRLMRDMAAQLSGRTGFLLVSDDPISLAAFKGFNVQACVGHELIDLYSLAGCDYVMGPPSTYSAWAAFYGSVPLCHIETADAGVVLDSFRPVLVE
jgi:hypothetical protein